MQEPKIKKSFHLVKEDIADLYSKIEELADKIEEMRVSQVTLADKIVKKADKKATKNTAQKKTGKTVKKSKK